MGCIGTELLIVVCRNLFRFGYIGRRLYEVTLAVYIFIRVVDKDQVIVFLLLGVAALFIGVE